MPALCEAVNAYNSHAARGGLDFAGTCCGKSGKHHAMAPWKARARPAGSTDPPASDHAAGVLGEVLNVAKGIDPVRRAAVPKGRVTVFRAQRLFLYAGQDLRTRLVYALDFDKVARD